MSQLFKEFYNSFGQAIHPLCKRYAVISRSIFKEISTAYRVTNSSLFHCVIYFQWL